MRPRGTKAKWHKVLPWYYTRSNQQSRQRDLDEALAYERAAETGSGTTSANTMVVQGSWRWKASESAGVSERSNQ